MQIARKVKKISLIFTSYKSYHIMTPEDYLFNQRDSILTRGPQTKILSVLQNANQGPVDAEDEISLVGVPRGKWSQQFPNYDTFQRNLTRHTPDLLFLDIDPSAYIARERFASHKCALNKVEDYYVDGIQKIDPHKPLTWEQTVVNLFTLDMLNQNKIPKDINYRTGLYTYSYPYLQDQRSKKQMIELTDLFTKTISTHVLDNRRTQYNFIDKVLYTALLGKQKVMLGGMPQTLNRMILGNSLSIHQVRDIFRLVVLKNRQLSIPLSTKQACQNFLPHIFQLPKDLYMTAMLKSAFEAATQMIAFVGIQHWHPMQRYWIGPPHGVNYTQATYIPQRLQGQSDEDLIQKQAIFEVLMDSRAWGRKYISNPFPYLLEDITKASQNDLKNLKKCFSIHYKKYSMFKEKQTKAIQENSQKPLLQQKRKIEIKKIQENSDHLDIVKNIRNKFTKKQQEIYISSLKK